MSTSVFVRQQNWFDSFEGPGKIFNNTFYFQAKIIPTTGEV